MWAALCLALFERAVLTQKIEEGRSTLRPAETPPTSSFYHNNVDYIAFRQAPPVDGAAMPSRLTTQLVNGEATYVGNHGFSLATSRLFGSVPIFHQDVIQADALIHSLFQAIFHSLFHAIATAASICSPCIVYIHHLLLGVSE